MRLWIALLLAAGCNGPAEVLPDAGAIDGDTELDAEPMVALDSGVALPDCGVDTACGVICTSLEADPNNCGACGRSCVIPNAEPGCSGGDCVIASCAEGYYDNDGDPEDGCEVLDTCTAGAACNTACGTQGSTRCDRGVASCDVPPEACNLADDNCDGQCDEGASCRVGIHRAFGDGHLYTSDLGLASTPPFNLEAQNFFFLYLQEVPASQPVFLCRKADGKRLLTSSTDCEFIAGMEATLGYWTPEPSCGTVPLYRLYHAASNDHFYTLSEAERDNAVTAYGYESQGIAGWVWTSP